VNRAREHERQAIAEEIDDGVQKHLITFRERLPELLAKKGVGKTVVGLLDLKVGEAARALQQISHNLNPMSLEEHGLVYGLDILSRQYNDRGRLSVKFSQQENSCNRLAGNVEREVYRVIQDLFRFVEQSEGVNKGKVHLRCSFSEDFLKISLREDVIGFDPKSNNRNGANMAALLLETVVSRIERIDGEISIFGTEGAGTLLKINLKWSVGSSGLDSASAI